MPDPFAGFEIDADDGIGEQIAAQPVAAVIIVGGHFHRQIGVTEFGIDLSPDELHTVFNFPYLCCPWDAARLREVIDSTLAFHAVAGALATWVLSNHDVDRHVSRYGRADTSFGLDRRDHSQPVDLELGTRRARAAALLTMALPGSVYLYQGEELGLWEVEDIPDERRQDPIWYRTGGADPGRDGCRVPLPWAGLEPPFGFSPPAGAARPANTPARQPVERAGYGPDRGIGDAGVKRHQV